MILGGSISSALTTFAGLGLAMILERDGATRVRLGWTEADEPRMFIEATGYDDDETAAAVHSHAAACSAPGTWINLDLEGDPWKGKNAVFSPRVKAANSTEQWYDMQLARYCGIDSIIADVEDNASAEMIGALGEPAYWRFANNGPRPDEGANRWEMKTRNRGEDFVSNRLRQLASIVNGRDVGSVRAGLVGEVIADEAYEGKRSDESRTSTGLTGPRFTDSALAWCALWGISSFPVVHRLGGASVTAGAIPLGKFTPTYLALPVLVGPQSLERWRALIVSRQFIQVVEKLTAAGDDAVGRAWLVAHGVRAIAFFHVNVTGSKNAPERFLGSGRIEVLV